MVSGRTVTVVLVGDLDDGTRVVLEPVLSCVSRNLNPTCRPCSEGHLGNCEHTSFGNLAPGIQTGSCHDTGGGWSTAFSAHPSQLHPIPDVLDDEAAVMIEPTETESKEMLDQFAETLFRVLEEPDDLLHEAPHTTQISRPDEVTAARKPVLRWNPSTEE